MPQIFKLWIKWKQLAIQLCQNILKTFKRQILKSCGRNTSMIFFSLITQLTCLSVYREWKSQDSRTFSQVKQRGYPVIYLDRLKWCWKFSASLKEIKTWTNERDELPSPNASCGKVMLFDRCLSMSSGRGGHLWYQVPFGWVDLYREGWVSLCGVWTREVGMSGGGYEWGMIRHILVGTRSYWECFLVIWSLQLG